MNVDTILRNKGHAVESAPPGWSVAQVCERLDELGIGALVVSTDGARIEGIVSERDVINRLARHGAEILERPVAEIMERNVVTCASDDDIAYLMDVMTDHRVRHLPVTEEGRLIGLVSIGDLVKHRIRESEQEATDLRAYITAG